MISDRIMLAMKEKGWGFPDLARATGISRQTLWNNVRLGVDPSATNLKKIADATGKSVDWFFSADLDVSGLTESDKAKVQKLIDRLKATRSGQRTG